MSNDSSRELSTLTTTFQLVVIFITGPGNCLLMVITCQKSIQNLHEKPKQNSSRVSSHHKRITCWGTPSGEAVSYSTFQSKNANGSPAKHCPISTEAQTSAAAAVAAAMNAGENEEEEEETITKTLIFLQRRGTKTQKLNKMETRMRI